MPSQDAETSPENKAQRLELAANVAPFLRASTANRRRRVTLTGPDGSITGYTTLAVVQDSLLAAHKIAIETLDGVRPEEFICKRCGRPEKVPYGRAVPSLCIRCSACKCADCGTSISRRTNRRSAQGRCTPCSAKARKPRLVEQARQRRKPVILCQQCTKPLGKAARGKGNKICRMCYFAARTARAIARAAATPPRCCVDCGAKLCQRSNKRVKRCRSCGYKKRKAT